MITLNRLQQIIPADQALANKALSVALQQITGINNLDLPTFAIAVKNIQTTRDLPLITALQQAVPPAVANYYISTLANGGGTNGDVRIVDMIGLAGGWVATNAFARTVEIFNSMDLSALTSIYQTMVSALDGDYGPIDTGPLVIPSGPCAGTYVGNCTPPDPGPPPTPGVCDPQAIDLAMACLTGSALTEINNLQTTYPSETNELNNLWNQMCQQVVGENNLQTLAKLNYADLIANDRTSIYSFIFSLPDYGRQIEVGGLAQFIESLADLSTQGGQAVVACLREGINQTLLGNSGIGTNSIIPSAPNPPPPKADLIPSTYTEAEAENLVIK